MSSIKSIGETQIELVACCLDCKVRHNILTTPGAPFMREMDEWENKHRGHRFEFNTPHRDIPRDFDDSECERLGKAPWWLNYKSNANIKLAYASSTNITITLASLASDDNVVAGRASTAVDNTSNLYLDYGVSGFTTTGTSPTNIREIDIFAYAAIDDVPTYPPGGNATSITGSDANFSFASNNQSQVGISFMYSVITTNTSNQTYSFRISSLASFFGGFTPFKWGLWVVHNTGVALNATSGFHQMTYKPVYMTSI